MNHSRLTAVVAFLLLAGTASAQEKPRPTAELPVRRIVLFTSGVGFVQREGEVEGNARVQLQFHTDDVNDLLKSLVVQDRGGQVGTVHYDSRDPVERTLKTFAIDLTGHPSLADLLKQARGERVEVADAATLGKDAQPRKLTGVIVGVQSLKRAAGRDQVIEVDQLNLLTDEGLQGIALDRVQRVRFLRPETEQEFRKALDVLAGARDQEKKTITLNFLGTGKRPVRVGYVTECPLWKTSYRLSLEKDGKAFLQGWAIVENTGDDDWKNVRLSLVSGRPISFLMDLYEPLYVPRPVVEPELFASLRPQAHEGAIWGAGVAGFGGGSGVGGGFGGVGGFAGGGGFGGRFGGAQAGASTRGPRVPEPPAGDPSPRSGRFRPFGFINDFDPKKAREASGVDIRQGVASAALAMELGGFFHYDIEQPVNLPRQKSALLPIVNNAVEAAKVSVFNESVHEKYPLLGLRLTNTSSLHLMQGPITVFDAGSYAGDAQIANLQPKETRLVTYAVDLGTEVVAESKDGDNRLVTVQIAKGALRTTHRIRHTRTYTVKNRSPQARTLLIEHPYREKWSLVSPEKFAERTRDLYRFEVKADPDKTVRLEVAEDEPVLSDVSLTGSPDETVALFLRATVASAAVRKALDEVLRQRGRLAETQREIQAEDKALADIEKDQERMRNNMARVPKESAAFQRYLKKFDEQETEIEKRRERVAKLQATAEEQRKALEKFVSELDVQ